MRSFPCRLYATDIGILTLLMLVCSFQHDDLLSLVSLVFDYCEFAIRNVFSPDQFLATYQERLKK